MKKLPFFAVLLSLAFSCAPKENTPDYTQMSERERLDAATEIAQSTIMVDGHVDLPYRMKVGGLHSSAKFSMCPCVHQMGILIIHAK